MGSEVLVSLLVSSVLGDAASQPGNGILSEIIHKWRYSRRMMMVLVILVE